MLSLISKLFLTIKNTMIKSYTLCNNNEDITQDFILAYVTLMTRYNVHLLFILNPSTFNFNPLF